MMDRAITGDAYPVSTSPVVQLSFRAIFLKIDMLIRAFGCKNV